MMVDRDKDVARPSLEALPGAILDRRYRVRREIARGGMGVVLEVEQVHTLRRLALKLALGTEGQLAAASARLMREGRALELSRGRGVVDVVDAGLAEGEPFLVLEMLDGRGLDALLTARRTLPLEQAVGVVVGICDGLESTHRGGVVHRDVKPSNVFVAASRPGESDRVVLIDYGISRVPSSEPSAKLTRVGERPGTPDYMSPEQFFDGEIDPRSDLFSVGLVLYEMLVGEGPFPDGEMLTAVIGGRSAPSLAAVAPRELDAWLARVLAQDPKKRPQSARELADGLLEVTRLSRGPLHTLDAALAPGGSSKRQHARAPYVAPIRVIDAGGGTHDGQTADLSEGGVLGMFARPIEVGARVTLRFGLPISGRVSSFAATVRWARAARHGHAIGLELVDAPPDALAEVRRYVALVSERTG
jgi:serine/threonine-protein kinase